MIIDNLLNAGRYNCIHPLFAKAFEYINSHDFTKMDEGKFEIEGEQLRVIISNKKGMTADESISKFECHDKHIDIQFCINGKEQFGWKSRRSCTRQKGEYNEEKDVLFYDDAPDMYFQLTNNQFAIFFPEDVHAPMIGEGEIKKLVIKVRM